jgi:chromosome segregation ATPase
MRGLRHQHKELRQQHEGLRHQEGLREGLRQQHEGLSRQHEGLRNQHEELRHTKDREIADLKRNLKASKTAIAAVEQKLERTREENTQLRPLAKEGEDKRITDKKEPKSENSVPTRERDLSSLVSCCVVPCFEYVIVLKNACISFLSYPLT